MPLTYVIGLHCNGRYMWLMFHKCSRWRVYLNDILTEKLIQTSQVDHLGHENIKPEINKNYVDLSSFKWQYKLIKDKSANMLY